METQFDPCFNDNRQLQCEVQLQNRDLWKQFHELETEMIITKSGRRMFPALRIQIKGLNPLLKYCVLLEFTPITECRYKYGGANHGWSRAGIAEPHSPHRVYLHPNSPASGTHWMEQTIHFNRVKLTNSSIPHLGHVVLSSMHKYQPRIVIIQSGDARAYPWVPSTSVSFPETQFIAVTAYQNDKITKLKIDNNPFAKGFRENGQSRYKRKRENHEETTESKDTEGTKKLCISSDESASSSPETSRSPKDNHVLASYNFGYSYPPKLTYDPIHPDFHRVINVSYERSLYSYANSSSYWPFAYYCKPPCGHLHLQDLPVSNPKPKKLTDFSIRAIIES